MKKVNYKKLILPNIPYVFIGLLATKLGQAARLSPGADFSAKVLNIMDGISMAFSNIMPSFHPIDLLVGIAAAVIIRLVVYFKGKNAKKFRKNLEYGSARWGNRADIEPFMDPVFENNVILTQTESLMMSNRPKDPKNARNKNVLVIGGSGSGKTRFFLKPNLMQMHSSYVVTDPKGSVVCEVGKLLERNNYKIKIFNTINFKKSMHYNPFAYIHSEKDILKLVTTLMTTMIHLAVLFIRKELNQHNRYYAQMNDMVATLQENATDLLDECSSSRLQYILRRLNRLQEETQMLREYASQVSSEYQAQVDLGQNRIMKLLTIVTTIFMPLSLIAGWYGMNFVNMPELHWVYGYPAVIVLSALIVGGCIFYFKKKRYW